MKLQYDLDKITGMSVPAGRYRCRLVKVEQTLSKQKKPMLIWHWKVADGEFRGRELLSFTSLLSNALQGLKEHLEAFKLSGKVKTDTTKLIGKYAILIIVPREQTTDAGVTLTVSSVGGLLPDKKGRAVEEDDEGDEYEEDAGTEEEEIEEEEESEEETEEETEDDETSDDDDDGEPEPPRRTAKKFADRRPKKKVRRDDDDEDEPPF